MNARKQARKRVIEAEREFRRWHRIGETHTCLPKYPDCVLVLALDALDALPPKHRHCWKTGEHVPTVRTNPTHVAFICCACGKQRRQSKRRKIGVGQAPRPVTASSESKIILERYAHPGSGPVTAEELRRVENGASRAGDDWLQVLADYVNQHFGVQS